MTTPRNIKVSVINDLRTYAIHRKHMEKSEMSEISIMPAANTSGWGICISEDGSIICAVKGRGLKDRKANAERIKSALNALAGRDPEKLEGLLEAVQYAKHELARHMSTREGEESEADLLKAYRELDGKLAAFEGGSHE